MSPGQEDGVPSVIVRTPRLHPHRSAGGVRGPRLGRLTSVDRPPPEPTRRRPARRIPPAGPDRRSRSPRVRRTSPGPGEYRHRTRAAPATSPPNWPHRPGQARTASPPPEGRSSPYGLPDPRTSPVGHHRPDGPSGHLAATLGPAHDVGQPRAGKGEEPDVVLAQVGPVHGGVGERRLHPGTEPPGRPEVVWQSDQSDAGLQRWIVKTPGPVDHHHDSVGSESFSFDEGAHHRGGQPWSPVREHDRRDRRRRRASKAPASCDGLGSLRHAVPISIG